MRSYTQHASRHGDWCSICLEGRQQYACQRRKGVSNRINAQPSIWHVQRTPSKRIFIQILLCKLWMDSNQTNLSNSHSLLVHPEHFSSTSYSLVVTCRFDQSSWKHLSFLSLCHSLSSWISPYIDNINQSVSATSALQLTSAISALQDFSRQRALGQQT